MAESATPGACSALDRPHASNCRPDSCSRSSPRSPTPPPPMPPGPSSASPTTASCSAAAPPPTRPSRSGRLGDPAGADLRHVVADRAEREVEDACRRASTRPTRTRPATTGPRWTAPWTASWPRGMKPILTITGPGPLWSSRYPGQEQARVLPEPERATPRSPRRWPRATATAWTATSCGTSRTWPPGCSPQAKCSAPRVHAEAPHVYRNLVRAAYPAVHKADKQRHGADRRDVLARQRPASANSTERPLVFLRALGCVGLAASRRPDGPLQGLQGRRRRTATPTTRTACWSPRTSRSRTRTTRTWPRSAGSSRRWTSCSTRGRLHGHDAPLLPLPGRVRLPDEPAGQDRRRLALHAGQVAPAGGVHGLARPAREAVLAVPVARRPGQPRGLYCGWQSGLRVRRRAQAKPALEHFGDAVRARQPPAAGCGARCARKRQPERDGRAQG